MTVAVNSTAYITFTPRPHDVRCAQCGTMLMRARLVRGSRVDIRCRKCGKMNVVGEQETTENPLAK